MIQSVPYDILPISFTNKDSKRQPFIVKGIQNKLIHYFGRSVFFNGYVDGAYKYHCVWECIIHITVVQSSENLFRNYGAKILLPSVQVRRILK